MNLQKFSVKRSQWLRGEGSEDSYLLRNSDKKMCCLGFCSLVLGYTKEDILNIKSIINLDNLEKYPNLFFLDNNRRLWLSDIMYELMVVNDDLFILDELREQEIKEKFIKLGFEVMFED